MELRVFTEPQQADPLQRTVAVLRRHRGGVRPAGCRDRARSGAIGREPAELRKHGLAGSPEEVLDRLAAYAEAGSQRVYLQVLDLADLEHLHVVAAEVMGAL